MNESLNLFLRVLNAELGGARHAEPLLEADPWEVSGFPEAEEAHAYFERGRSW